MYSFVCCKTKLYTHLTPRRFFNESHCAIFAKNIGGEWFYANSAEFPIDGGDAAMISLETSKERNLSRLWDSSVFAKNQGGFDVAVCAIAKCFAYKKGVGLC